MNSEIHRLLQKDGPYRTHSIVPSDRLSTSLITKEALCEMCGVGIYLVAFKWKGENQLRIPT